LTSSSSTELTDTREVHNSLVGVYYLPGYGNTNLEKNINNFGEIKWLHGRYFGRKILKGIK